MRHHRRFLAAVPVVALAGVLAGAAPASADAAEPAPAASATVLAQAQAPVPAAAPAPAKASPPAASGTPGQGGLTIDLPRPPGFKVGYQKQAGRATIVELVPEGETVEAFTTMVTLQTAVGFGTLPPEAFLTEFSKRYAQSCPNSQVTAVPLGAGVDGIRIDCTRKPSTTQIDTVFARAIDLGDDLAFVQVTLRHLAMPAEGRWARDYLASVVAK